ncbi:hypothetical protein BRADI_4g27801v3 [Brachypodium distachyon]|uniref:Uncharacterized protein n=1 Tax=Brachypodium distachyon TaxID=15368 RepID=A0A0Q3IUV2_BRADI|nr:hypothetical protein BRADI_4g27801v3 [Brachypodium distachyon]
MPSLPSLSFSCDNLSCNIWFCCGSPKDEPGKHDDSFRKNPDQPAPMQSAPHVVVTPVSAPKRQEPPPQPAWIPSPPPPPPPPAAAAAAVPSKRYEPPPSPPSRVPSKTYDGMLQPAVSSPTAQAAARAPASQYPPARQLNFDDAKPSVESYPQAHQVYY